MRLLLAMMLLGCGEEPVPSAPVSNAKPEASPTVSAGARPVARDVVQIPSGVVTMGPRRLPAVSEAFRMPAGGIPPATAIAPEKVEPSPWVSMGGHGLPPRTVMVDSFVIDRTEVTKAAYFRFLRDTGYRLPHVSEPWAADGWNWAASGELPEDPNHPVVMVNFYDARAYCRWRGMRLPTEAEWQLAALGPQHEGRIFPWGNRYDDQLLNHGRMEEPNFDDADGHSRTAPVGSYPAGRGPYGLDDAFGNAWEFTADFRMDDWRWMQHDGYGTQSSLRNARMRGPGLRVAVRGGSFYFDFRPNPGGEWASFSPEVRRKSSGFRCAADA